MDLNGKTWREHPFEVGKTYRARDTFQGVGGTFCKGASYRLARVDHRYAHRFTVFTFEQSSSGVPLAWQWSDDDAESACAFRFNVPNGEALRRPSASFSFEDWIIAGLASIFFAVGLTLPLEFLLAGTSGYVPPKGWTGWFLVGLSGLTAIIVVALAVRKLARHSIVEWFAIVAFIPIALLLSIFVTQATGRVLGAFVYLNATATSGVINVFSSRQSGGRGCHIRNDFYIDEYSEDGYWCGPNTLATGIYTVRVARSSVGSVVVDLPGLPRASEPRK
jgi:hypothetical protein